MRLFLLSILAVTSTIKLTQAQDKLAFVYELVRHGARAPIVQEPDGFFKVNMGLLTATGMRQRNILGKYNRQRYIERAGLLDEVFNPAQMYIQSTGVDRTLQSTYAELLGLYPPTQGTQMLSEKIMPLLKVRRAGLHSQMNEMYTVQVPVYSYLSKNTPEDDITPGGCTYAYTFNNDHWNKKETYETVADYILPVLREPVGKAFGKTKEQIAQLSFVDLYLLSDILLAENMEGDIPRVNFTSIQWHYIREVQKIVLMMPISDFARDLWITKQFRAPLRALKERVAQIISNNTSTDTLRYLLYSAHDLQIANVLSWLQPDAFQFIDVPYVSNFFFELSYDEACLATTSDSSCFSVEVLYNNQPLRLGTCLDENARAGRNTERCTYTDFVKHIESLSFKGDLAAECDRPWNRTPTPFRSQQQQV